MPAFSMRREERLTRSSDFARVYNEGKSWANRLLVMRTVATGRALSRVGFSVSKRVGNAVVRNRVKRMLREAVRAEMREAGWDVVFIARAGTAASDFTEIRAAVSDLVGRSNMWKSN